MPSMLLRSSFQQSSNDFGVACVGPDSIDDGSHDASVDDVSQPAQTDRFLRTIVTPGTVDLPRDGEYALATDG